MNVTVLSSPERNAYRIGADTLAHIQCEAARIANIDLAAFLCDVDTLTVALYASHPSLCAQYLSLPRTDYRRKAAYKAQSLHSNMRKLRTHICDGFFHRQLRVLLEIGHANSDFGAKLVPIIACMLEHQEEHFLDDALVDQMQRFLAKRDFVDGYVIVTQTTDTCCITPSLWRKGVA